MNGNHRSAFIAPSSSLRPWSRLFFAAWQEVPRARRVRLVRHRFLFGCAVLRCGFRSRRNRGGRDRLRARRRHRCGRQRLRRRSRNGGRRQRLGLCLCRRLLARRRCCSDGCSRIHTQSKDHQWQDRKSESRSNIVAMHGVHLDGHADVGLSIDQYFGGGRHGSRRRTDRHLPAQFGAAAALIGADSAQRMVRRILFTADRAELADVGAETTDLIGVW